MFGLEQEIELTEKKSIAYFMLSLMQIADQAKIIHWQTRYDREHRHYGAFYEGFINQMDTLVEAMIGIMENRQPSVWWAARDAISGSIGPFLHKRMRERNVFAWVNDEIREDKDLERRAQSIRNRMAMGMVRFPAFAPWFGEAEKELTTFPNAGHDDFVAALAMLGMGMNTIQGAAHDYQSNTMPKPGTMAWARGENKRNEAERKVAEATKGW